MLLLGKVDAISGVRSSAPHNQILTTEPSTVSTASTSSASSPASSSGIGSAIGTSAAEPVRVPSTSTKNKKSSNPETITPPYLAALISGVTTLGFGILSVFSHFTDFLKDELKNLVAMISDTVFFSSLIIFIGTLVEANKKSS